MTGLSVAFVAKALLYALQTLAFAYVYRRRRERPAALWMCGSALLLAFAVAALATELRGGMPQDEVAWLLLLVPAGLCVADGAARFVEHPLPRIAWIAGATSAAWAGIASLAGLPFPAAAMPAGVFGAAVLLAGGTRVLRSDYRHLLGARVAGATMILWGLHFADYPLLRELEWFAPIGFLIAAVLDVTVALGLLVLHFEVARDRTIALEAEREQGRKLEALGRVAGGIAHDFNNLLTVILPGTDLLRRSPSLSDCERRLVTAAGDAAARASTLTSQLLAFSRRCPKSTTVIDLAGATSRLSELARSLAGDGVRLQLDIPSVAVPVAIDRAQLEQVLLNIVVNARDAMPNGGDLTIRIERIDGDARLEVIDTGDGMAPDVIDKAFEPFYTTRSSGEGTGLGLAIVHGIVTQVHGDVCIDSAPGRGTSVRITLPIAEQEPAEPTPVPASHGAHPGRVLLAEDEPLVRQTAAAILESCGYAVVTAENGNDALALLDADVGRFDLVVTDVVMPGLDGIALARELERRDPDLPVLLTSGYPDRIAADVDPAGAQRAFLAKPYSADALLAAVDRVRNPS